MLCSVILHIRNDFENLHDKCHILGFHTHPYIRWYICFFTWSSIYWYMPHQLFMKRGWLKLNLVGQRQNGWHFTDNIFKIIFRLKTFVFWFKFCRILWLMVHLIICQHWFCEWIDDKQAILSEPIRAQFTDKYASLGLSELMIEIYVWQTHTGNMLLITLMNIQMINYILKNYSQNWSWFLKKKCRPFTS